MTAVRRTTATLLVAGAALTLATCKRTDAPDIRTAAGRTPGATTATPSPGQQTPDPTRDAVQDAQTRIGITIGDRHFEATLDASAATRDLIDQLSVTLQMVDHGGVEKTGRLPPRSAWTANRPAPTPTSETSATTHQAMTSSSTAATSPTTTASS